MIDGAGGVNTIAGTVYRDVLDFSGTTLLNVSQIDAGAGEDSVIGSAGNDVIIGGPGGDSLSGGAGDDTYRFDLGWGNDAITENDSTPGNRDVVSFGAGVAPVNLVFENQNGDLVARYHGSADAVTIQNWYQGSANQTETFQTSEGHLLTNTQVDQLIQAMAQFSASHGGISWDQAIDQDPAAVQSVLSAYWQPTPQQ